MSKTEEKALTPFETKNTKPEWEIIYDYVQDLDRDEIITYEELSGILGRSFRRSRTPIYKVMEMLEEYHNKTLVNVKNVGYRVSRGRDHLSKSAQHYKKMGRQLKRTRSVIDSTDFTDLDVEERKHAERKSLHAAIMEHVSGHRMGTKTGIRKGAKAVEPRRRRKPIAAPKGRIVSQEEVYEKMRRFGLM